MLEKGKRLLALFMVLGFLLSSVTVSASQPEGEGGENVEVCQTEIQTEEEREEKPQEDQSEKEQQEERRQETGQQKKEQQEEERQEEERQKKEQQEEEQQKEQSRESGQQEIGREKSSISAGKPQSARKAAAKGTEKKTITEVLGIDPDTYLSYIRKYSASGNKYYLGTPYPTQAQANLYGGGIYDFRSPNGDKWQGFGLMQCTGFVWHVLVSSGSQEAKTPHLALRSAYYSQRPYSQERWYSWLEKNQISCHDFSNKNEMLRSGTLDYGDLIWIWDESVGADQSANDHHVGIYLGDGSSDRMWHSISGKGNVISEIVGKAARVSYTVVDTTWNGYLKLKKKSGNAAVTDDNSCYSLEGAEYSVYKEHSLKNMVGKMVTDKYGGSDELELPAGIYYVKETKPPKGFAEDPTIYEVKVAEGTAELEVLDVTDTPVMDRVGILLRKVDAETDANRPQGNASLEGARFEVKYYKGNFEEDPAEAGEEAERTWILRTDENGECRLDDESFVSGDAFYRNSSGEPAMPLGTVTLKEVLAPEGYLLNPEVYVVPVTDDGKGTELVRTYNAPKIPETPLKLKIVKKLKGTEQAVPGAVFVHTLPDGAEEQVTTDEKGEAVLKGLTWGEHVIREISVPDGIEKNPGKIVFTVEEGNRITVKENTSVEEHGLITVRIEKDGNLYMGAEDDLTPYKVLVHKRNENEEKLPGAVFEIYTDPECRNCVQTVETGEDGTAVFTGLEPGRKYYLRETKAPDGYRLPLDEDGQPVVHEIETESNPVLGIFEYYLDGKRNDAVSGTTAEREVNVTVVNRTGAKLPETGTPAAAAAMAAGTVVMAVSLFGNGRKRKDRR